MASIKSAKVNLRKQVSNLLKNVPKNEILAQSETVARKVFSLPQYQNSNRISVYLSTPTELNTTPILENIFKSNKKCFIPRFDSKKTLMEMVKLDSMDDFRDLPTIMWNIKQPKLEENRENAIESGGLDLILLPGVAFPKNGYRLGHGKGYYDSFLHEHQKTFGRLPYMVGLALKEQIYDEVPVSEHDVLLDTVIYA